MKRILVLSFVVCITHSAFAQPTPLTVWTRLSQEATAGAFDGFRKAHPEIALTVENIPGGKNHINKLMAAVAAKSAPDVTTLDVIGTAQFARLNALMPLDAMIAARPTLALSQFSPGQGQTGKYDGKQVALPFGGDISVIFYNRDMFHERGLDPNQPPRTWAEFTEAAKRLTVPPTTYGFEIFPGYPTTTTFYGLPYLWLAGGDAVDPKTHLYAFNSPAGVEALTYLSDLHLKHHAVLPSAIGRTGDIDPLLDFQQKRVAMAFGGGAQLQQLQLRPAGFAVGIMQHPTPTAGMASTSFVGGDNVAIMSTIPRDRLAAATVLVEYLVSAEGQRAWWVTKAMLPVRQDLLADPYYDAHPLEKALLAAYLTGHQPPDTSHYVEMQQYLRDAYQSVFFGQTSPKEALDEATAQGNALIKRTGAP